ncbi:MAG: azurin [Pseudomonadota bacterium]
MSSNFSRVSALSLAPIKNISLVLTALAVLSLSACGGGDDAKSAANAVKDDMAKAAETVKEEVADVVDDVKEEVEKAMDDMDHSAMSTEPPTAVGGDDGDPCNITVTVGDAIAFSTDAISVPSSCGTVNVTLTHTGKLPAQAMGHNWVLLPEDSLAEVAGAGMGSGLEGNYLPADEPRIVAATKIIGGGESASVSFSLDKLEDGRDYIFVCTFPGHWNIMKGTFSVSG